MRQLTQPVERSYMHCKGKGHLQKTTNSSRICSPLSLHSAERWSPLHRWWLSTMGKKRDVLEQTKLCHSSNKNGKASESILSLFYGVQSCLPIKLRLRSLRSNKPRPPSVLGIQIVFQATKAELFLLTSPVHRKFLHMLIIFLSTMSGMGKIFSQNWTFPNRTDRRSSKRPAYGDWWLQIQ
jgi:hypothetical protein